MLVMLLDLDFLLDMRIHYVMCKQVCRDKKGFSDCSTSSLGWHRLFSFVPFASDIGIAYFINTELV